MDKPFRSQLMPQPAGTDSESINNTPDQHGFVMIGTKTLFLHHLPMFGMQNHMYQVILQAHIPAYAQAEYLADRAKNPGQPYILGNVQYDLFTLPEVQTGERVAFTADIFRGLPTDPNKDTPLIHNLRVDIERVVFYRPFDFSLDYPPELTYILFGADDEAHMAHLLTKNPDFDHVLDLASAPDWLPPLQLEAAVQVNFPDLPSQPIPCTNPLTDPSYLVHYQGQSQLYPIAIGATLFFDTAGLNTSDPCASS